MVTAEAAYRIIDQASKPISKIRDAALEMDKAVGQAGKALDNLDNSRNTTSLRNVERSTSNVGRATEDMGRKVEQSTQASGRAFEKMRDKGIKSVEELTAAIKRFEHERATATLDVDIAKAEAKIRLLKHELRTVTTQQAQKELGDLGFVTQQLASSMVGGAAGNGPPGGGGGLRAALGGVSGSMGLMATAALALAPAVVALTGATSALVGSLGAAAGGAGALGVGAIGAFVVGLGAIITVAKPAITQLGEVKKAQDAYNRAVQTYGDKSAQAVTAHRRMLAEFKKAPGAAGVLQNAQVVSSRWKDATAPARESFFGMLNDSLRTTNALLPTFGAMANRVLGGVRTGVNNLLAPFRSGEWRSIFRTLGDTFARISEGPGSKALANFALWFGRIARAASPVTVRAFEALERWTSGLADRAGDTGRVERTIERWVGHLKEWVGLTGAAMRLLGAFFGAGAAQGKSVVESITDQFDRWTAWLHEHPAEVQDFFRRTIDSAGKLADAIGHIVSAISQIADALLPVLNMFSDLVSMTGGAGMLGPLALLGGARMLGAGRIAGGLGGALFGRSAAAGATRVGTAAAGEAAAAAGAGASAGLISRARGLPGSLRSTRDLYRYNLAMEGSRGAAVSGLFKGGAGTVAKTGLRAVGKVALPLTAALAAWDFATAGGSAMHRTGAAVNGALFNVPQALGMYDGRTREQVKATGNSTAAKWLGDGRGTKELQRHIGDLQRQAGAFETYTQSGLSGTVTKVRPKLDANARRELYAQVEALQPVLKAQLQIEGQNKAVKALDDIQRAYEIRLGAHRKGARKNLLSDLGDQLKRIGPEGKDHLLKGTAAWTAQLEHGSKQQKATARALKNYIIDQFKALNKNVRIVNGKILTGTTQEWQGIKNAMSSAAEQALQEVTKHFTELQKEAVGSLIAMGFSPSNARTLVRAQEQGGRVGRAASGVSAAAARGENVDPRVLGRIAGHTKRARGGRVQGIGSFDSVTYGNAKVAPGELVVNQHTERKIDQRLGFPGALGMMVNNEHTPHGLAVSSRALGGVVYPTFAYGGSTGAGARGAYGGVTPALARVIRQLDGAGFHHGSTTGGGHAANSYHYRGMAVDYGSASNNLGALWRAVWPMRNQFAELLGPQGLYHYGQAFRSPRLQAQHNDHIHLALAGGMGAQLAGVGNIPGMGGSVRLRRRKSRLGGVPGALSTRAAAVMAGALEQKINAAIGGGGGGDLGAGVSGTNQAMARQMMSKLWPGSEWGALKALWTGESGFNEAARNPSSGAYGIPQALPASKMGPAAQGTGPAAAKAQINWGLHYIRDRYGSPSNAYAKWQSRSPHWYAKGGRIPQTPEFGGWFGGGGSFTAHRPTLIGVGDGGAERVTVRPAGKGGGSGRPVEFHFHGDIIYGGKGDLKQAIQKELAEVAADLFNGDDSEF